MSDQTTGLAAANAFLTGSVGAKSAKFENPGDVVQGLIVDAYEQQQTQFAGVGQQGPPKFWDDGKPMMQLVVILATQLRENGDDDGQRALYLKGSLKDPHTSAGAVAAAVAASGVPLQVGGNLAVAYIGLGPGREGLSPPKQYAAQYSGPVINQTVGQAAGQTNPFAGQQAPTPQQQTLPPAQPAPAQGAVVNPFAPG